MNETVGRRSAQSMARPPAPFVMARWDHQRITFVTVAALLPAVGMSIDGRPTLFLSALGVVLAAALAWSWLFAHFRQRPLEWDWIMTGMTFAILVPDTVPIWQQLLALSFGVVMGEQIFGGRGRNFLHPTTVALAFLMFSFPGDYQKPDHTALAVAASAGGLLLLGLRIVSWRVLCGIAIGATVSLMVSGEGDWHPLLTGIAMISVIFLIADPVAAASTNPGRWLYGLLAGMLMVVFGHAGGDPGSLRAIVFAALLAGVFAPLIDQIVIWLNVRRRRRRD
ncbi:RnfABCDGE type electron transport complex subunit D [Nitratireductor mangrovi]|uniref:RnfABCDGE type electron transport complex subunit D n=1 Tax=Nitratireductor mangrovi TaxID=2599600 RepID=A0A5B8L0Y0_9HYPH|nr:RnfABCDGE type electron transport complex subunit D [Nitratireductor mangrovi]QDZ01551.1 RnfABCDGE type electron transport complex subunit D [Nitratireductor mangrovi]